MPTFIVLRTPYHTADVSSGPLPSELLKNTFLTVGGVSQLLSQKVEPVFLFQKLLVSRELIHVENRLLLPEFKTSHELIYQFFL